MDTITITLTSDSVVSKAKQHLALIGKRARDVQGKSLFSDLTFSEHEKAVFPDLVRSGAETLANHLAPFCGNYSTTSDTITFKLSAPNWKDTSETYNDYDITKALEEAIKSYLFNFAIAQYLSIIHPSTGEKYPPLYGVTYTNQCAVIVQNIISICNVRRPSGRSNHNYSEVFNEQIKVSIFPNIGASIDTAIKVDSITVNDILITADSTTNIATVYTGAYSELTIVVKKNGYQDVTKTITPTKDVTVRTTMIPRIN